MYYCSYTALATLRGYVDLLMLVLGTAAAVFAHMGIASANIRAVVLSTGLISS
jgi:hypothetical protein